MRCYPAVSCAPSFLPSSLPSANPKNLAPAPSCPALLCPAPNLIEFPQLFVPSLFPPSPILQNSVSRAPSHFPILQPPKNSNYSNHPLRILCMCIQTTITFNHVIISINQSSSIHPFIYHQFFTLLTRYPSLGPAVSAQSIVWRAALSLSPRTYIYYL